MRFRRPRWSVVFCLVFVATVLLVMQGGVVQEAHELSANDAVPLRPSLRSVTNDEVLLASSDVPPVVGTSAPMRLEFGLANSKNREQNKQHLGGRKYGVWALPDDCNPCQENCMTKYAAEMSTTPAVSSWGPQLLDEQIDDIVSTWKEMGGITFDMLINMNSCAYKTRTRWNAHGLWLHVFDRNVTVLRMMADGYRRAEHIKLYIKDVVARSSEPFTTPLVFYVSVNDIPCNVAFPYFTFFGQRGVMGIPIPDDSFHRSVHGGSWESTRSSLLSSAHRLTTVPYSQREHKLFFRGSPTHIIREQLRKNLTETPDTAAFSDIRLAVMERFKQFKVPLPDHARYQYLLAVRGKTASSRDKYLNLLGSTIVWVSEDEPWFQFYHRLWKPYLNYVPMSSDNAVCVARMLQNKSSLDAAALIAQRSQELGRFLTQDVVDAYFTRTLRRYADIQTFTVPPDAIDYMKQVHHRVKKKYRTALVMPDDQSPVKFYFDKWISRRIKQMSSCRTNNTYNGVELPRDSKYRCWYM